MDKDQEKAAKARDAALNSAITQIQREFGEGSIMKMGDEALQGHASRPSPRARCRSTSRSASAGCRAGGSSRSSARRPRARRRWSTTCSPRPRSRAASARSSTPSTRWTPIYAKRIGVDVDELLVSQPDHGEQALEIADLLIRSGTIDVVAIDSVAALTPKAELEGADGRPDGRPPGAHDEPGDAQARRQPQPRQHALRAHQPDPREGRRDVRLAGDPAGRPRAEVLLLAAPRHPPHRDPQGGHRGGRQPGAREGRQEQGRGAVPPGRVRHRVRRRASPPRAASSTSGSSTTSSRSRARSSPTATSGSARAATTPRATCARTPRRPRRSRRRSTRPWASAGRAPVPPPSPSADPAPRRSRRPARPRGGLSGVPETRSGRVELAYRALSSRDRTVAEMRDVARAQARRARGDRARDRAS